MKEKMAITGYVLNDQLKSLKSKNLISFEVFPESETEEVYTRVSNNHIAEVRVGAAVKGRTMVQLILNDDATYETIHKQRISVKGIKIISDPALSRLIAAATAKSIMV
jgi:hypothetical protein